MSKVKHLQQRLDDLRERERLAKLHNRELLQQFDEAQNTLREVLDHTAAMKMLQKKYESCHSHWNHQLHHKTQNPEENKNLKTNHQHLHLHDRGKTGEYQELSIPPEPLAGAQTQTTVFLKKISQYPPSSFPDDLFRPHLLRSRPQLECTSENNGPSNCYLSHTSSPNELHTDQLWPAQTETTPKRLPSCLSEDSSHSEDLDVKPVRLSSDQTGGKTSSRASSEGRTEQTKSNQSSSSDEDMFVSHKSVPSREVSTGSKAMTFSNHKTKHRNGLDCKDTKNKDNTSESHSEGDESDVDESSKLSQEAQGSGRLKKRPTLKEKEQSLSDQSSLEEKDSEKDQTDGDGKETSQDDDGEMSNLDISGCSPIEEAYHKTLISGPTCSSSDSAEESASSECDGSVDNMKVCESNQDTALGPVDSDSEDCIVSPQTRSKIIYVIPEHEVKLQDGESNRKSTSDDEESDSSSEEDIESVLAPQEQTQKQRESKPDKSIEPCESDDFYDE